MASVNKVILVGNLGRDPEMRTFPSGDQVANVTIATTDRWRDKNTGENKEATEWHRVVFNGRLAEIVGQYLRKGSQVYVEGSLRTRKWTAKTRAMAMTQAMATTAVMLHLHPAAPQRLLPALQHPSSRPLPPHQRPWHLLPSVQHLALTTWMTTSPSKA